MAPTNAKKTAQAAEMCSRPNIEKLTAYINCQPDPERFMRLLFALAKPDADDFTD